MAETKTDSKVQLGCGTLIIIAIIVMMFSGGQESKELKESIDALNAKVERLEQKIDELSKRIPEAAPAAVAQPGN
jgi:outer membrane murein-binding lipoprotein Lpp